MKKLFALVLCLCLLAGCTAAPKTPASTAPETAPAPTATTPPATQPPETTAPPPPPDYGAEYLAARTAALDKPALRVTTSRLSEVSQDQLIGQEKETETVLWQDRGGEAPVVAIERKLKLGTNRNYTINQVWSDGQVYTKVAGAKYVSPDTLDTLLVQCTPTALLDPENYAEITRNGETITFAAPVSAEDWALPDGAVLLDAVGSATVRDGVLVSQRYERTCSYFGMTLHDVWESELDGEAEPLSERLPADAADWTAIDCTEALLMLLRAENALQEAQTNLTQGQLFSADRTTAFLVEAAGIVYWNNAKLSVAGSGKDLALELQDTATFHEAATQETTTYVSSESVHDGEYTYKYNDDTQVNDLNTSALNQFGAELRSFGRQLGGSLLPGITELTAAKGYDFGDYYLLEFEGGEAFADRMEAFVLEDMLGGAIPLRDYASEVRLDGATSYVALEKHTWLPTGAGRELTMVCVIDGLDTALHLRQDCGLRFYDPDIYKDATGEALPDAEPEVRPTPVFYEVTGQDGETLYLFGTIHVGDDRTGFLPQVVLDALDNADALAVEFDGDAFEEALSSDPELMQKVSEAYYYTDGTTIQDHLDPEVYERALAAMKVTGSYADTSESLRPFVWENTISNFYLSQGRTLSSDKGVDNRLMARARDQGKEILNVESGLFQIEMMAGYSDALQEALLEAETHTTRARLQKGTLELYELWCEGDEAALIAAINAEDEEDDDDGEPLTEEEQALYDEYHQKLEVERNRTMLETAKEYLAGGKTVFFAVGLAHLLGEEGLVEALRAAGYTVTRVETGE